MDEWGMGKQRSFQDYLQVLSLSLSHLSLSIISLISLSLISLSSLFLSLSLSLSLISLSLSSLSHLSLSPIYLQMSGIDPVSKLITTNQCKCMCINYENIMYVICI